MVLKRILIRRDLFSQRPILHDLFEPQEVRLVLVLNHGNTVVVDCGRVTQIEEGWGNTVPWLLRGGIALDVVARMADGFLIAESFKAKGHVLRLVVLFDWR